MFKWSTKRLAELAEFRNGVNYDKSSFGLGMKVIGVSDFQDYSKPNYDDLEQINPEGIVTERNILHDGDIIFVRSNGNRELIGRSLFIEKPPEEVTHSAFTIRLRFTDSTAFPKFFAYCFRTQAIRQALTAYGGGTNISNLNQEILSSLQVPYPPRPTQLKTAAILSAYDDLIDNNQRRIKILEEIAQNLYREWFVKFHIPGNQPTRLTDSPLGRIPEGWEVVSLGMLAELRKNKFQEELHSEYPLLDLAKMQQQTLSVDKMGSPRELTTSRFIFEEDDILFGSIRPYLHKIALAPCRGVTNVSVLVVRPSEKSLQSFLAVLLSSLDTVRWADQHSTGTKMPVIKWEALKTLPVLMPTQAVLRAFETSVQPIMQTVKMTSSHNHNLRLTRDLLLPRLISGEVDVSELDIVVPEEA